MSEQTTITCPHCGFSKAVSRSSIPENAVNATCPACKRVFLLHAVLAGSSPADNAQVPVPAASVGSSASVRTSREGFEFVGTGGQYFGIWIVNTLLKIFTFGIYSAWAKVRMRRFFYGSTRLQGHAFEYLADPRVLFKGWLIAVAALAIYMLASRVNALLGAAAGIGMFALLPWLIVRSRMFNNRNSAYRNIRFGFKPAYREAYVVFAGLPLLSMLTLGLLSPYAYYRQKKFLIEKSSYGNTCFEFKARVRDFYLLALKILLGMLLIAAVVFGLAVAVAGGISALLDPAGRRSVLAALSIIPFVSFFLVYFLVMVYGQTAMANLCWNNVRLGGNAFESRLKTLNMSWLFISNAVAIMCSLGLLMPWAMVRMTRYRMETLVLISDGSMDSIMAGSPGGQPVGAAGEEIGDVFDMPVDIAL